MYRAYENPHNLEDILDAMRQDLQAAIESGADEETIMYMQMDIDEMKDRINHAWQDDEYDSDNCSGDWED